MATTDPPSCADADGVVYLAVVLDSGSPFRRAHHGEVGLTGCPTLVEPSVRSAGAGPWGMAARLRLPMPAGRAAVARRGRHRSGALDRLSGTATALGHAAPPPIAVSRGG